MTDQERKMIEIISESEGDVQVPERLKPEMIEKMLVENQKGTKRKVVWWKNKKLYGALAATMALVIGLGISSLPIQEGKPVEISPRLATAESYDEVYEQIEAYQKEMNRGWEFGFNFFAMGSGEPEGSADMAVMEKSSAQATGSSSDTNVRTEGVGEADIVKTNGKYLFAMQESATEISIIDATTDKMKELGRIKTENEAQISEFYVKDDKVFLFTNISQSRLDKEGYEVYLGTTTCVETYEISDAKNPKKIAATEQSGFYQSSRIVGDYIYTFSNHNVYTENNKENIEEYIPLVNDKAIAAADIYMPERGADQYIVITTLNVNEPEKIIDHKAVLTDYGTCYVSAENIYIYETVSRVSTLRMSGSDTEKTAIRKIGYKDGKLSGVAKGSVDGWIKDSFCIDEYEGNLRIVTTIEGKDTTTNSVYVLDKRLNVIGEINGLAKDERVYSARLFGDTGYFVTYRETDPLFSVDFSDPTNPQIIGKLKIPGFSEYLHFYGEDQLIGIGMDTEEETGITNGVKLSMFDISDPTDVTEKHVYTIEDMYSSEVFWDYKAVLVDYEKNIIGFSCSDIFEKYYIFSYDEKNGFQVEMEEHVNGNSYLGTRGVYIEERFYVIKGNAIESYRMGTFEKIDDLLL